MKKYIIIIDEGICYLSDTITDGIKKAFSDGVITQILDTERLQQLCDDDISDDDSWVNINIWED